MVIPPDVVVARQVGGGAFDAVAGDAVGMRDAQPPQVGPLGQQLSADDILGQADVGIGDVQIEQLRLVAGRGVQFVPDRSGDREGVDEGADDERAAASPGGPTLLVDQSGDLGPQIGEFVRVAAEEADQRVALADHPDGVLTDTAGLAAKPVEFLTTPGGIGREVLGVEFIDGHRVRPDEVVRRLHREGPGRQIALPVIDDQHRRLGSRQILSGHRGSEAQGAQDEREEHPRARQHIGEFHRGNLLFPMDDEPFSKTRKELGYRLLYTWVFAYCQVARTHYFLA